MCSPDFFGAVFIQGGSSAMTDIMLVDDEVLALEYLKNMVDWERNGYHVVGCATSGKKALELFDRTHPQIVISDIRMPGTDGLELTRQIKEKDKETVVILLSAYRDFDYAQKGIRYGVSNYLLKHELSSELILKELEEVKEKLERAGNKKKIYQKYFMNQLIYHRVTAEELDKSILGNRFFLLLLHKRNPVIQGEFAETRWTEEEQEAVRNILEESLENIVFYAADVQITENNWILLYRIENTASKYMVNSLILRKCHQIADQLELCLQMHFNMVYSYEITPKEISETFRTISRQIRYSVFWEDEAICAMEKMPEKEKKAIWGEQIRILREAIYGSEEELEKQIEAIFSGIREKEDLEDCKMLLPSLSNLLGELCESENCKEINLKEPLYTIREIEQYYCRNFSYIQQKYARKARLGYSRTVLDMIDYIEKNYPQELSLELLGEKFHMNGVYLGQIFKKETGQTFLKYLTNVRISEAKRLLREENSTVAETAQMVGYRTSQYFSQIFMRNVGMKPQEYKKQRKEKRQKTFKRTDPAEYFSDFDMFHDFEYADRLFIF